MFCENLLYLTRILFIFEKQLKNIHLKLYIKQKRTLLNKICVIYYTCGYMYNVHIYNIYTKKIQSTRHLNEKFRNRKSPIRG